MQTVWAIVQILIVAGVFYGVYRFAKWRGLDPFAKDPTPPPPSNITPPSTTGGPGGGGAPKGPPTKQNPT